MNYWAADNGAPQAGWVQPIATFIIEGVSRFRLARYDPLQGDGKNLKVCRLEGRHTDGFELITIRVPCAAIHDYHVGDALDIIHRPGSHS